MLVPHWHWRQPSFDNLFIVVPAIAGGCEFARESGGLVDIAVSGVGVFCDGYEDASFRNDCSSTKIGYMVTTDYRA